MIQVICLSSYETTSSEDSSGEEDQDEVEEVDSSEPEVEQGEESGTAQEEAAATGEQGDGVQAEVAEGSKEPDAGQAAMSPQEEQPVRWDGGPWWKEGVGVTTAINSYCISPYGLFLIWELYTYYTFNGVFAMGTKMSKVF